MEGLPDGLEREVSRFMKKDVVEKVQLFSGERQEFIEEICHRLEPVFLTPDEILFKAGEPGDKMYFIVYGQVDVLLPDRRESVKTLTTGMYFGEIALFLDIDRTATIQSGSFCDLYSLSKEDFNYITDKFPQISERIRQEMLSRVSELDQIKRKH